MFSDCETEIKESAQCLEVGIGFGSNVGDRLAHLSKARELLLNACHHPAKALFSPVYETLPVGCAPGTRPFYNAVGQFIFFIEPESILDICLKIERSLGRQGNHQRNSPRTIDLDLLYAGDIAYSKPRLTIPHPRLTMRLFVLAPLAIIRPGLYLPGDNLNIKDHFDALSLDEPELQKVTHNW